MDLNERVADFRECARLVWNMFVMPNVDEAWDPFDGLERELFRVLVLNDLPTDESEPDVFRRVRVSIGPQDWSGDVLYTSSLAQRELRWTAITFTGENDGITCRFRRFFDWESSELRDFAYAEAVIVESAREDLKVGGGLLIPASRAQYTLP